MPKSEMTAAMANQRRQPMFVNQSSFIRPTKFSFSREDISVSACVSCIHKRQSWGILGSRPPAFGWWVSTKYYNIL